MPKFNEYAPVTVTGVDDTDLLLWEIDGVTKKMPQSEYEKLIALVNEVAVSATTYTFLTTDQGKEVRATAAGAKTFTIPSTSGFAPGVTIMVSNRSVTAITLVASGTTLNYSSLTIAAGQSAVIKPRAGNEWDIINGGGSSAGADTLTVTGAQTINNTTIDITFNSPIAGTTGFSFTKDGSAYAPTSRTIIGAGNTLRHVFSDTMVKTNTLAYSYAPGTVEDTDGNALASTSGSVINTLGTTVSDSLDPFFII